ncbi:hypothetical protein ACFZBU_16020 [Embleya sp. NPDC008237]|uniref:hypothetical protein n=1 Tax=Embleya sp. NPDC008237 TaxID=3363978 RepID=UPI0036E5CB07
MGGFLGFLLVAGCLATTLGCCAWMAAHVRRRGVAGAAIRAAMASYDEALHGTANDAHIEIQVQAQRKVPMRSPDDPWRPHHDEPAHPSAPDRRSHNRRPRRPRLFPRLLRRRPPR